MDKLIPTINKLQMIFASAGIDYNIELPQIAVIGAQSSGKSSVLESIVGRDFLPRGSGIVTRAATVLQLIRTKENNPDEPEDYAIFGHRPGEKFTDFSKVRDEIQAETNRLAGENKGISERPIILRIFSPYLLNLTLIDLPGLTKVPVGSQPQDIDKIVRNMVLDYIRSPNCIVLAVSAANTDIATSDSLHLAREVDPKGDRTFGVLTKLDIMDKGTDALRVLKGKEYPLKLGYVGVVCRSQEDIQNNKSLKNALKAENKFFENSAIYKEVKDRSGIPYLSLQLSKLLNQHILKCLPELKKKIDTQLNERKIELASYGHSISDNPEAGRTYLLSLISDYSKYYRDSVEGSTKVVENNDYKVGARIQIIFQEYYVNDINNLDPFDELADEDIRTAILNAKALNPSLFIPEAAFELLIRQQINRLLVPSLSCALQIHNELRNMAIYCQVAELDRFEKLKDKIMEVVTELLKDCLEPTEQMIRNLIEVELGYINVNHPDVLTGISAVLSMLRGYDENPGVRELTNREEEKIRSPKRINSKATPSFIIEKDTPKEFEERVELGALPEMIRAEGRPSAREALEVKIIKELMLSYFKVVVTRVADIVPKVIVSFLVEKSLSEVHDRLVHKIFTQTGWEKLMEENPLIAEKKANCKNIIAVLKEAQKVINEIRNTKFD
eukprot:TRINITY_DN14516_c0_g1_i1.p1 TRINITY_DN14516_c0_g1~~TRINITY_DN14516_c0_g1_i1.p1  ORF type:complete len:671 (+),score=228.45 TRINITY_DN14516_c0_g1_i1:163-2175(+)